MDMQKIAELLGLGPDATEEDIMKALSALLADLKQYPGRYVHLSVFGRDPEKMKEKADRRAAKAAARAERDSLRRAE